MIKEENVLDFEPYSFLEFDELNELISFAYTKKISSSVLKKLHLEKEDFDEKSFQEMQRIVVGAFGDRDGDYPHLFDYVVKKRIIRYCRLCDKEINLPFLVYSYLLAIERNDSWVFRHKMSQTVVELFDKIFEIRNPKKLYLDTPEETFVWYFMSKIKSHRIDETILERYHPMINKLGVFLQNLQIYKQEFLFNFFNGIRSDLYGKPMPLDMIEKGSLENKFEHQLLEELENRFGFSSYIDLIECSISDNKSLTFEEYLETLDEDEKVFKTKEYLYSRYLLFLENENIANTKMIVYPTERALENNFFKLVFEISEEYLNRKYV